jgi:ribosomal protein S18 acetylase RimI-like enzyme
VAAIEYSAKPKTKHKALVVGMYVLPHARGRGVAKALIQAAIEHASSRSGITVIQLEVTHGNDPATALYEGLGFQAYGIGPMAVLTPSGYRSKVHMWRQLGSECNAA